MGATRTRSTVGTWLGILSAGALVLVLASVLATSSAGPSTDIVERRGIVASLNDDQISSAVSAFAEETRGTKSSTRAYGCLMVQSGALIDRGCGTLMVTTDAVAGTAQVSGVIESDVYSATSEQPLRPSSIQITATSLYADPPVPCAGHDASDPVTGAQIRAGIIRQATIGWDIVSAALGTHTVPPAKGKKSGERYFFIDETGVIRASTPSSSPTCDDPPLGG
jgi:hypothetical protein